MKGYQIKVTSVTTVYVKADNEAEALCKAYNAALTMASDSNDAIVIDVIDLDKGSRPVRSSQRDKSGEFYWMCPNCKNRVGGYVITGGGGNDWCYEQNRFCRECGTKIVWE